ncbi:DUF58 domain-containing protein [uncultured Eubacterium sp.]|uniref:DUF58 domain-containing protein n=1 Tax=uncultured Eubacterium sp. TaxID=165185 RepID=UPI0026DD3D5C|nr:DUF58 domain-containing protein [uncultured Eubacterium sp.]
MNRKSLGFFLLLLLFLISAVVWRQKLFLIIPIIMILTGILTFAYAKLATTNLNAELKFTNVVDKGKNVTGKIIVNNKYPVPLNEMVLNFEIKNILTGETKKVKENLFLGITKKSEMPLELESKYCGCIKVELKNIEIFDIWGIASIKKNFNESQQIYVMPYTITQDIELGNSNAKEASDTWQFMENVAGVSGEVFDIKEYQIGDNIKNIHWKLTGKYENPMVKKMAKEAEDSIILIFDNRFENSKYEMADALAEMFISLSRNLLNENIPHTIGWWQEDKEKYISYNIRSEQDLVSRLPKVLAAGKCVNKTSEYENYIAKMSFEKAHTVIVAETKSDVHNIAAKGVTWLTVDDELNSHNLKQRRAIKI